MKSHSALLSGAMTVALTQAIQKSFMEHPDTATYHIERLDEFPEGEWFSVSNTTKADPRGDSFAIFSALADRQFVARKTLPLWLDGSFRGNRVLFLYRHNLDYTQDQ